MSAEFEPNPEGIRAALASEAMYRAMEARAKKGRDYAFSIAPVKTGQYKYGAILLHDGNDPGGHRRRRTRSNFEALPEGTEGGLVVSRFLTPEGTAGARLTAKAPHARFVEFGTRYMRAQHILGRSLDAMR